MMRRLCPHWPILTMVRFESRAQTDGKSEQWQLDKLNAYCRIPVKESYLVCLFMVAPGDFTSRKHRKLAV